MLVLSRKRNESIVLDGNIRITILQCGQQVRLGITAPKDVSIRREELVIEPFEFSRDECYTIEAAAH